MGQAEVWNSQKLRNLSNTTTTLQKNPNEPNKKILSPLVPVLSEFRESCDSSLVLSYQM